RLGRNDLAADSGKLRLHRLTTRRSRVIRSGQEPHRVAPAKKLTRNRNRGRNVATPVARAQENTHRRESSTCSAITELWRPRKDSNPQPAARRQMASGSYTPLRQADDLTTISSTADAS